MKILYIRDKSLHFKKEGEKTLVLKKNKKEIVELNEVGSLIWDFLEKKKSKDSLVKEIASIYKTVDSLEITKDVEEFLEQCSKDYLVKKVK